MCRHPFAPSCISWSRATKNGVEKGLVMEATSVGTRPRHKTFTYRTTLTWSQRRQGQITSEGKPSLHVSSPPEFKGDPGFWTPEDLFVAAVETCTMTTFLAFAQRLNVPFSSYSSSAEGTLEFLDGKYQFTQIVVKPTIEVPSADAIEQVKKTLEEAHKNCLVSNSIKGAVTLAPRILVNQPDATQGPM